MTRTIAQIEKQIARLKKQADAIKQKEVGGVVARIKEAIAHYGLTAADLGLAKRAKAAVAAKKKPGRRKKRALPVKFRDAAGNSWNGHGRRPKWFLEALASGKSPDDLLV